MTYQELKVWLETLTPIQLSASVTVFNQDEDEYLIVTDLDFTTSNKIEDDLPILCF